MKTQSMADSGSSKRDASEGFVHSASMEALFAAHRAGLRRFVVGVVHDLEAAEDIVQTTFTKAIQAPESIPSEAMKSWLYRVAFHEAVTWKRRFEVDRRATRELGHRGGPASEIPEDALVLRETVDQVRQAMQELPAQQREVVLARMEGDKTFAQIAVELDLPLGTVLTHMRRALEKLRKKLHRND
jgi:RNA polymerase sigma-70 factor (ECF subfamily)